jgi:hypothetical protein
MGRCFLVFCCAWAIVVAPAIAPAQDRNSAEREEEPSSSGGAPSVALEVPGTSFHARSDDAFTDEECAYVFVDGRAGTAVDSRPWSEKGTFGMRWRIQ